MIPARARRFRSEIYYCLNILTVLGSWWIVWGLRTNPFFGKAPWPPPTKHEITDLFLCVLFSALVFPALLSLNKVFHEVRLRTFSQLAFGILKCAIELVVFIAVILFFFFPRSPNRFLVPMFGTALFFLSLIKEYLIGRIKKLSMSDAKRKISCFLIGGPSDVAVMKETIEREKLMLRIEGIFDFNLKEEVRPPSEFPILNTLDEFEALLEKLHVGLVVFCTCQDFDARAEKILRACDVRGVEVWFRGRIFESQVAKIYQDRIGEIPILIFSSIPPYSWALFFKRVLDLMVALCFLPVFGVLFLIIGLGIKLSSPGPVLFKQKRSGLFGKPFIFYKFRTMRANAEQEREELQRFNMMQGPVFKVKNDPRVFPFGKFLRKTSLDETPQVLNILMDQMSVVGPRPLPVAETAEIRSWQRRRFSMKPGITCLWQVQGRNKITDFQTWVQLDLEYIDKWSLLLDLKIFLKTIWVVLTQRGSE